jgi:hypothetical protein
MADILRQLVRTSALCGTLGLILYLAFASVVDSPRLVPLLPPVLALVLSGVALVLTGRSLILACRTGEFPSRGRVITRAREPEWFWGAVIWYGGAALCFSVLVPYSLLLLVDAWSSMPGDELSRLHLGDGRPA